LAKALGYNMAERARKSLSATQQGLELVHVKLKRFSSNKAFADLAGVSRATVQNFLAGKPLRVDSFRTICQTLELNWEEIAGFNQYPALELRKENLESNGDELVQEACLDSDCFVGRQEAIKDISAIARTTKVILIQAEGGIGKTTFARRWFKQKGLDVLELSVGAGSQSIYSADDWIRYKLRSYFKLQPEQSFRAALEQLKEQLKAHRIGVLIDNLESVLVNGELIEPHRCYYLELLLTLSSTNVATLITSREALSEYGIQIQTYQLQGLTHENWAEYFEHQGIKISESTLKEIYYTYGGNAEAMSLLSGDIKVCFQGNSKLYWQTNRADLAINPKLENLVKRQFEKIKQDDYHAYSLLCRLGCYRYECIPYISKEGVFRLAWDLVGKQRQKALDALISRSLIKTQSSGYYLHPIFREEARERLQLNPSAWSLTKREASFFLIEMMYEHQDFEERLILLLEILGQIIETSVLNFSEILELERSGKINPNVFTTVINFAHLAYDSGIRLHQLGITCYQLGNSEESRKNFQESRKKLQRASLIFNQLRMTQLVKTVEQAIASLEISERSCYDLTLDLSCGGNTLTDRGN
jgi:transcriptional regulator with XRE-family HTH domain